MHLGDSLFRWSKQEIQTKRLCRYRRLCLLIVPARDWERENTVQIRPQPLLGTQCRDAPWRVSTHVIFYTLTLTEPYCLIVPARDWEREIASQRLGMRKILKAPF